MARLKEHEAELKQLGVEHLYLFGSTARDEAREDSDVDLFFDYGRIARSLRADGSQGAASEILGRKTDIMTRDSLHKVSAGTDRRISTAGVLMATRSPAASLTDIVEAIEHVQASVAMCRWRHSRQTGRTRWLVERGVEIISEASRRSAG